MTTIKLEGLDFYAHHGFYEEERKIGNKYTVDVTVILDQVDFADDDLTKTVNYEQVYQIVAAVMAVPTKLLETISSKVNHEILNNIALVSSVETTVSKHNPPIKGVCGFAKVSILKKRD